MRGILLANHNKTLVSYNYKSSVILMKQTIKTTTYHLSHFHRRV